jgi:uncharacterized protein (DUF1330 family)
MTKGYWIRARRRRDPTRTGICEGQRRTFAATAQVPGAGGKHEAVEGSARARNVVIDSSFEQPSPAIHDEAYQKAKQSRPVANADVLVIEGYDGRSRRA